MLQKHLSFWLSSFRLFRERSGNFKQFLSCCCRKQEKTFKVIASKWSGTLSSRGRTRDKKFIQNAKCKPNVCSSWILIIWTTESTAPLTNLVRMPHPKYTSSDSVVECKTHSFGYSLSRRITSKRKPRCQILYLLRKCRHFLVTVPEKWKSCTLQGTNKWQLRNKSQSHHQ